MSQPLFLVAAVSEEYGLEGWKLYEKPVTSEMFIEIFDKVDK